VFLNTTGDLLDDAQQSAFERYIRAGGGFAGVHAAADAEYEWPWYGELLGAYFQSHPSIQWAGLTVEAPHAPSTAHLPPRWTRTDEWYNFRANPRDHVDVLLTIDESTYDGGAQGDDHPIAWRHEFQGGRAWYTAGGHTSESFNDPLFLTHVIGGILWAAGRRPDELDAPLALAVVASDDDSADAPTHSIDSVFADLCGAIGGAVGIAPLAILLFIGLPQHTRRCDRTPAAGARTRTR
jgi:type 1 glutamine amidotransferase